MQMQVFNFQSTANVRTCQINCETYFIAKDVCLALDYTWSGSQRIAHVPAEWRGVTSVMTPSGAQEMAVLSEAGLYFFLSRSDKPKARPFQKWIAGDVVPSIRKHGVYIDESHPKVQAAAQSDVFTQSQPDFTGASAIPELVLLRQLYATQARLIELMEVQLKPKPRRTKAAPWTDDEIRMARAFKAQGMSQAEIARKLNRSESSISMLTRELH